MSEFLTMLTAAEVRKLYGVELADLPFGEIDDELLKPRPRNGRKAKPVDLATATPAVDTLSRHFAKPRPIETVSAEPEAVAVPTVKATPRVDDYHKPKRQQKPKPTPEVSTAADAVVNRTAFHKAVNLAAAFAFRRSALATETGLLIIADGKTLSLLVRSRERTAAVSVPTIACGKFTAVACPTALRSILAQLNRAKVQAVRLTAGADHVLTVQANGSETMLTAALDNPHVVAGKPSTCQPDEFPAAIDCQPLVRFAISVDALDLAIQQTQFATDVESTRYALGGILIGCNDKTKAVHFAATDSRRLAVHHAPIASYAILADGISPNWTPVVPWDICYGVRKLCDASKGAVTVELSANRCRFSGDGWTVATLMIEGRFPRYRDVIPRDFSFQSTCNAAELLAACRVRQWPCGTMKAVASISISARMTPAS